MTRPINLNTTTEKKATVVWGEALEQGDFIKVPRILIFANPYLKGRYKQLKPQQLWLLLALGAKKYEEKPLRIYWETLAVEMGVNKDTVRKWAYQLRDAGFIRIKQNKGRENGRVGTRNDKNTFDLKPIIDILEPILKRKKEEANKRKKKGVAGE